MRIIIDGDACPQSVKKICEKNAKKYDLNLKIVVDMEHAIESEYEVIIVEKGRDAVDFRIVQLFLKNDILVTQDYGLASIVLPKAKGIAHTAGFEIDSSNIDTLLQSRYIGQRIRKTGGRTKGPSKRTKIQDAKFEKVLVKIITS
ncbi:DUF188 domain-containing protein [Sedimentibacter sp. zth1]|uniref:YaiI/YqxD family protein n=1 Tax=Sedimentibacter sp. zth1 TaxID=2816908 RepID=UPI001A91427B|nr:DUF188 domain-containing protein [Sedimentibacter sp. zth1]QSX05329.1 DUF188 domain-containing protein [Sedimentibacter sp. zth1]